MALNIPAVKVWTMLGATNKAMTVRTSRKIISAVGGK